MIQTLRKKKFSQIAKILKEDWDPIGVAGAESTMDEYDGYAGQILARFEGQAKMDEVSQYLKWAETYIGICTSEEKRTEVANKILRVLKT